ncbi:probable ubiquitin-conjugating enzyme E2 23 [Aegilops tauschii subsp. strangulata]|uniref:Putative ubiquitin carrier protein E2 23 n=1 Tax=Aegilops tauschii TaxID=37682 RepID=M8CCS1_AEGTA
MGLAAEEAAVSTNVYWLDLVRFEPELGGFVDRGLVVPPNGMYNPDNRSVPASTFMIFSVDGAVRTGNAGGINLLDRSYRGPVQIVGGLSLGDYVVSGLWLGRVVEVSLDVDVLFDDGAVCRVTDAESKKLRSAEKQARRTPGSTRDSASPATRMPSSRPLGGFTATGNPAVSWAPRTRREARKKTELELPMSVSDTRTTVDVLWQDGTVQHGAPSTSVVPFEIMNEHEFFPGQYVVDNHSATTTTNDGTAQRLGVVRSLNCKDQTVHVSWFKAASGVEEAREDECDDTVSAYDLGRDYDHRAFYGDVVVRLLSPGLTGSGCATPVQQPLARGHKNIAVTSDLSWVGRVVGLPDGQVQVKWGDGSMSTVLPHEITVVNDEIYTELQAEMGDWLEDNGADDAPGELGAVNTVTISNIFIDNYHPNPVEDGNMEGPGDLSNAFGRATTWSWGLGAAVRFVTRLAAETLAQGKSYLAKWWPPSTGPSTPQQAYNTHIPGWGPLPFGGPGRPPPLPPHRDRAWPSISESPVAGENVEVSMLLSSSGESLAMLSSIAAVTSIDATAGSHDSPDEGKKATDATGDGGDPFRLPRFDIVQSPSDHHYLEAMNPQDGGNEKTWVKTVQKEWKILMNDLPDTIYVCAFKDRMDLLRAVIVGASGTPYQDGLFFFDLQLPLSYPAAPPQVYYHSFGLRLNPNLYASGTVCLSLLNTFGGDGTEVWSRAMSTLLQVLVSIQGLVLNNQPYYNEAGYEDLVGTPEGRRNALPYNEKAYLLTLRAIFF